MKKKLLSFAALSLMLGTSAFAQNGKVKGKISAADGQALAGVSILVNGTSTGTKTNASGEFEINAQPGQKLTIRYVGFGEQVVNVDNKIFYTVQLAEKSSELDEVVIVAYGKAKKESITGAVSSVSSKDIEKRPISNALGALEGSASGIQVNATSGQPGAEPEIRIRGFTSINGSNSPLYVVDGVPYAGNVSDINPADIESISVLKDASSSALYGSRASNGVVIITTKKGSKGQSKINLVVNQGFYTRGIKEYERLDPKNYMESMWKGLRNSLMSTKPLAYPTFESANARASQTLISDYLYANIFDKPDTQLFDEHGKMVADAQIKPEYAEDLDWYKYIERTGHRQDYNLNGSSATEKSNLYYSVGYLNEKGYIKTADFNRFSGRLNADIKVNDWFKYGFNLAGSHQNSNNSPGTPDDNLSFANPYYFARQMAPIYTVHRHNADGSYALDENGNRFYDNGLGTRNQNVGRHAIWENELNRNMVYRNSLMSQAFVDIKFLKDFTLSLKGDLNVINSDNHTYSNAIIGDGSGSNGRAGRTNYRYKNYTAQQIVNWNRSFGAHHIQALVGHENFSRSYNYLFAFKTNQAFAGSTELINFNQISNLTDYRVDYKTEGYFSSAKYNYADKYFVDGSFRRDGTSKFNQDVRWGNFWSLGGAWSISKEDFFADYLNVVNNLRLRGSYGEVGNDASASNYAYMGLYTMSQNANAAALYRSQMRSDNLIWETSSSVSAALEGRLFNRANFSVEYFDKRSQNLLFDLNMPLSAGATSITRPEATQTQNVGSISNRGIELAFDVDIIRNEDWRVNFGANATWLKNKIVKLPEENRQNGIITGSFKYTENHGIYDFWTYQYAGVDQMTGNALYHADPNLTVPKADLVEINGEQYTTNFTYGLRDWSGSALPKVNGSFNAAVSYKSFTLSALFTYSLGNKVFDSSYQNMMSMTGSVNTLHKDILKAWDGIPAGMTATSENRIDPNGIPVIDYSKSNNANATSNRFLQDGSYLVIKNIAASYAFSPELVSRLKLRSLNVNMGIDNLATFTKLQGMNPQQAWNGMVRNAFVTPRVVSFGVNIGL